MSWVSAKFVPLLLTDDQRECQKKAQASKTVAAQHYLKAMTGRRPDTKHTQIQFLANSSKNYPTANNSKNYSSGILRGNICKNL
jgi:hypothetical protein